MTVRFFRLTINGSDENKLNAIKNWIDTKIEKNDLDEHIGGEVTVFDNEDDTFTLNLDMYIKMSVSLNKYKDIIVNNFTSLNKTGLTSAKIIQYDNCSHDSESPKPCSPTVRMEWNNGS